ncbi:MAG: SpoIIE family protein phosphatase [Bacteroidia bacterium]|nr:SpoIIE family protein phosphatase [Bacteroidia bacterium]MDW8347776.1 SpoIIE family protein phosphatase [Bacteroidia bacterium]
MKNASYQMKSTSYEALLLDKMSLLIHADPFFSITSINEKFISKTGLQKDELIGKNVLDLFSLYNEEASIDQFLADLSDKGLAEATIKLKLGNNVNWVNLYGITQKNNQDRVESFLIAGNIADAEKKIEQLEQNEVVKNYQRDITIAQGYIQGLLPDPKLFKRVSPNAFLIYMPMRGIGGDWYWFNIQKDRAIFLMGDVMGHGINAGIVTAIVATKLSEFRDWNTITKPTDILYLLHKDLNKIMKNNTNLAPDFSMDSVAAIYYVETRLLLYTSAKFSILVQRGDTYLDTNIQKQSLYLKQPWSIHEFTDNSLVLEPNDWIWVFSDGVKDQFDEVNQKRFGIKRLKELFVRVTAQHDKVSDVENALLMAGREWMGQVEQTDDIMLAGFKIV